MKLIQAISPVMVACCLATQARAADIPVPNGGFEILYKPGQTTITADTGGAWTQGVGPNAAMEGGVATFSDATTGTAVDIPGWINAPATGTPPDGGWAPPYNWPKGSGVVARQLATPYGTYYYSVNGTNWGNPNGGAIQSDAPLATVVSGQTYTLSMSEGPGLTGFVLDLLADGVILTPDSSSSSPDGTWTLRTKKYGATGLASSVGKPLTIRVGWAVGAAGARAQLDDVRLSSSVPDTTPPTLISFEHDKGSGPIVINEPVTYTVTFSEPMYAETVDATDFANTFATAITVDSVTPTGDPAVFLVRVTPTDVGMLRLQVMAGATLTDIEGNSLDTGSAIPDDSSLVVNNPPPTATTTALYSSGSPTTYGQNVTFTAIVSPIPSGGKVQFWVGENYLGDEVTLNASGEASVNTTTLGATTHAITADYSGNFQFEASSTAAPISQEVGKAPLTVRATNFARPTNTPNPDPLPSAFFGYQNGENLATSGVTGTPLLSTDAVPESPVGDYVITCALGTLAADNYSFTLENGTLTVTEPVQTPLIPGGDFQMYKPGTGYTVTAEFTDGASFARGVGDGITLAAGTVTYSDTTVGNTVDLPGWEPLQAGNDLVANGVGGSTGMNIFAAWGGDGRIQTTGSLFTVATGQSVTITAMVGGPDDGPISGPLAFHLVVSDGEDPPSFVQLVPTSFVDPTLPNGGTFQMISRTYSAAVLAPHIGASTKIVLGVEDANNAGNRVIFDDVKLETTSAPAGFDAWADANNATGQTPEQDHDNDGVENGIEYFMGESGSSFTAVPGLDATNKVTWTMDPAYEGTYEVQTSPDLVNWTNVDPRPVPLGGSLSYTLPSGLGKRFVRLLVTPVP